MKIKLMDILLKFFLGENDISYGRTRLICFSKDKYVQLFLLSELIKRQCYKSKEKITDILNIKFNRKYSKDWLWREILITIYVHYIQKQRKTINIRKTIIPYRMPMISMFATLLCSANIELFHMRWGELNPRQGS